MKDQRLYGLASCEHVEQDIVAIIKDLVDEASKPGDTVEQACNRVAWPVEVHVFRHKDATGMAAAIADNALERVLEALDLELGDPDGEATEPTEAMRLAAREFARTVCMEYVSWTCEATGEVVKVAKEDVWWVKS